MTDNRIVDGKHLSVGQKTSHVDFAIVADFALRRRHSDKLAPLINHRHIRNGAADNNAAVVKNNIARTGFADDGSARVANRSAAVDITDKTSLKTKRQAAGTCFADNRHHGVRVIQVGNDFVIGQNFADGL